MGKGDQKTRRGKLFKGSYGARRKRKRGIVYKPDAKIQEKAVEKKAEGPVAKPVKKTVSGKKVSGSKKTKEDTLAEKAGE